MKIKYMGTSDNRVLEKGETFGGRLGEPISQRVAWTVANNHLVDTDEVELSDEAIELLLDLEGEVYGEADLVEPDESTAKVIKEFKDVTDLKTIPVSLHQATYLGMKSRQPRAEVIDDEDNVVEDDGPTDGEVKTEARAKRVRSSGATGSGAAGVGGSTDGAGGDTGGTSTSGGGAGGAVGGSTGGNG